MGLKWLVAHVPHLWACSGLEIAKHHSNTAKQNWRAVSISHVRSSVSHHCHLQNRDRISDSPFKSVVHIPPFAAVLLPTICTNCLLFSDVLVASPGDLQYGHLVVFLLVMESLLSTLDGVTANFWCPTYGVSDLLDPSIFWSWIFHWNLKSISLVSSKRLEVNAFLH